MIKRYELWAYYDEWQEDECDDGEWVKYEDHTAELARRVLAAENLVDGLDRILNMGNNVGEAEADELDALIAAYREASK